MPQHADCQEKGDVVLLSLSPGTKLSCFFSVAIEAAHRTTKRDAVTSCILSSVSLQSLGYGRVWCDYSLLVELRPSGIKRYPTQGSVWIYWRPVWPSSFLRSCPTNTRKYSG
jgi:hypothetical protein